MLQRIQQDSEPSHLRLIWKNLIEIAVNTNEVIRAGAEAIVFLYYQAFWNMFDQSSTILVTARAIGMMLVLALLMKVLMGVHDAWHDFQEPVRTRPSLNPGRRESSLEQFVVLLGWFLLCVGSVWICLHIMRMLSMPPIVWQEWLEPAAQ